MCSHIAKSWEMNYRLAIVGNEFPPRSTSGRPIQHGHNNSTLSPSPVVLLCRFTFLGDADAFFVFLRTGCTDGTTIPTAVNRRRRTRAEAKKALDILSKELEKASPPQQEEYEEYVGYDEYPGMFADEVSRS